MGDPQVMEKAKDPKLLIRYYDDTDTLVLWNGTPAQEGQIIAEHLTSESDGNGDVTGIVLEHAAQLLRPYLFPSNE